METRPIAGAEVSEIGLGCMNLSHAYGQPPPPEAGEALLLQALDLGITHFDTAALYGFGANEELVGRTLKPFRNRIFLASKGGMQGVGGQRVIDGRPEALRQGLEDSLRRLQTDRIDLYYLHRWDKKVPIAESVGALARMVEAGKVGAIGLSEVSAKTLREAHRVHPIAALQTEYSLWTRNPEIAALQACAEIGAAFVAFSPLARGFLTGRDLDPAAFPERDIRRAMPRFQGEAFARNRALLERFRALAREAGCTPAQFALLWVLRQGPHVHVIPGTATPAHLRENAAASGLRVAPHMLEAADALINAATVSGPRYPAAVQAEIDTEDFPAATP